MPCYACIDCTNTFEFTFQFKQMCIKADDLLRQFPVTGEWPDSLDKPLLLANQFLQGTLATPNKTKTNQANMEHTGKICVEHESLLLSKKVLTSSTSSCSAMISSDISSQSERDVDDITFLNKIGNNELSLNHTRQLVAAEDVIESSFVERDNVPMEIVSENQTYKPKLLNKSSLRNLNKEAEPEIEPCLSLPKVNKGVKSKAEIVDDIQRSEKPYKCSLCDQAFSLSTMLADHEKTHVDVPKYVCVHCDQNFLLKEDMEKHVKSHKKNLRIVCKICNKRFANKKSLYRHKDTHKCEADSNIAVIETNIFPCSYCELSFPLLQLRDIHMKDHIPNVKFQCEHCEKSFSFKHTLAVHSTIHTGKRPFKCSVCNAAFSHKNYLRRHEWNHTDVAKYKCPQCRRSFLLKEDMENHVERHKNKKFFCKICNASFSVKQYLSIHQLRVHSRQRSYTCQYCGKCFQYKHQLSGHLKEHAGDDVLHLCKYCKKSFSRRFNLQRHMRSHKNVDDPGNAVSFMCMRCNCNFGNRDELISHSITHANEMNLACSLCKDVFDNVSDLKSHIQDHSQVKAYACEFCDLIFLTAEKLQSHADIDHINEMAAYHADDHAQSKDLSEDNKIQINIIDIADEKLQETTHDSFVKPVLLTNQFIQGTLAMPSETKSNQGSMQDTGETSVQQESLLLSKRLLSSSTEISSQSERDVDDVTFLDKIGNNELSLNYTRQLVAAEDVPVVIVSENQTYKPKLLNKSSMKKLNKEAEPENEPCLNLPKVNKGVDSKTEIVDDIQRSEKPFKCDLCDQAFSRSTMLAAHHEKTHMDVPKYVCVHCDQHFLLKEDMEKHVKSHNKNQRFACKICNKRFANKQSRYRHENTHKSEADPNIAVVETNIFPCSYCELSFPLLQQRDIHMKDHSHERPNSKFQCEHCNKSFRAKYNMEVHSTLHTGKRPFKCSVCAASFSHKSYLTRHERIHMDVAKYKCPHCRRSFSLKEDMENHVEKHKNEKFVCKICNASFSFKYYLSAHHRRLHSRQQTFTCQYCGKCFQYKHQLSGHLKDHTGDVVSYLCKYCKKSFSRRYCLQRHIRSHKNVDDPGNAVSFMCIRCNCNFGNRDELISHVATHANEMNLECSLCKDVFDNISDLKSHVQDHSQGETYACEFCDLIFLTEEKLQSHADIDHINEMEEYLTDDDARTNDLKEDNKSEINIDISDEKLQETTHDSFFKPVLLKNQFIQGTLAMPSKTKSNQGSMQDTEETSVQQESLLLSKKIPSPSTEISSQSERDVDCTIKFLDKIGNNELSLNDTRHLVAVEDVSESGYVERDNVPVVIVPGNQTYKPKCLDKSSKKIPNKEAEPGKEPCSSLLEGIEDVDSRTEVVVYFQRGEKSNNKKTHMDVPKYEADPNTAVIKTNIFPCSYCELSFPLLQLRDIHMKDHTPNVKFQCEHCEKSFSFKHTLAVHSTIHTGKRPFKCFVCDAAFSHKSYLTRHEKIHTDVTKYKCPHCERSFLLKEDMENHVKGHKTKRKICKVCNATFSCKQSLSRHRRQHSRQRPYTCQYCGKGFQYKYQLSRHVKDHAGDKLSYPCKYCKKSFKRIPNLKLHLQSHKNADDAGNAVSFMCMRCNCKFGNRDELIRHSFTHANEMNLECSLCKDVFDNVLDLKSHIQDHSQVEAYACEFCDLIFLTAEKLQSHADIDHINEMEAYHTDDRAQSNDLSEDNKSQLNIIDIADEKLQETTHDSFVKPVLLTNQLIQETLAMPSKIKSNQGGMQDIGETSVQQETFLLSKTILSSSANSSGADISSTEISSQSERDVDCTITFLDKSENEFSLKDIPHLIAAEDVNERGCVEKDNAPLAIVSGNQTHKPKCLDKSSKKIPNKEAEPEKEPSLSLLEGIKNVDSRTEISVGFQRGDKPYKCSVCDQAFSRSTMLTHHEKTHTNVPKYICVDCDQSFLLREDMEKHVKSKVCNKSFAASESLEGHNLIHKFKADLNNTDVIETSVFPCSHCERTFPLVQQRDIHMKNHCRERKFKCDYCEKSFLREDHKITHSRTHTCLSPFKCSVSQKAFKRGTCLRSHEKLHSNAPKHICQYCEQSFPNAAKLYNHLKAHAGNRRYHLRSHKNVNDSDNSVSFMCMRCNCHFGTRDELISHSSIHANEMNLECSLCKDVFDNISDLNSHIQGHSQFEVYACEFCDLIFLTAEKLQSHADIDHINEMEAYNTNDFMRPNTLKEDNKSEANIIDITDEKLQETSCDFFVKPISLTSQLIQGTLATPSKTKTNQASMEHTGKTSVQNESLVEKDVDCTITFLDKIGHNELSLNDTRHLVAVEDASESGYVDRDNVPVVIVSENQTNKPKLLNKSSMVILNKEEEEPENDPCLSLPKVNKNVDNSMEIVVDFQRGEKPHKCSVCDQAFSHSTMLTHHEKTHTDVAIYICVDCDESFLLKEDMEKHIKSKVCNKSLASTRSEALESGNVIHKREEDSNNTDVIEAYVFPCSHCERAFSLVQQRDIHMKNQHRERKFKCDYCEKLFFRFDQMKTHSRVHTSQELFKCSVCDQTFKIRKYLKKHEKIHTNVRKHICDLCERSFILKEDYEEHAEWHKKHKYFCKICNKGFVTKRPLESHEAVHSRQKLYKCQYCEESFLTSSKLFHHLTTHGGNRRYYCKYCKRSFSTIHILRHHLRTHKKFVDLENGVLFMCMRCNCHFRTRDALVSHSTTHANEMNLACSLCKDVFDNISDLKSHIQDHSQGKVYACEFCNLIFLTAEKLQSHADIDHDNDMEAYNTNDFIRPNKPKEDNKSQINIIDIGDEKLQETAYEFFVDEFPCEGNDSMIDIKEETDDHARAHELREDNKSPINIIDIADEKLQKISHNFFIDKLHCEETESEISLKKDIKVETETPSQKIFNQIIQSGNDEIEGDQNLLSPLKQRNLKMPQQATKSRISRRKVENVTGAPVACDNVPTSSKLPPSKKNIP